MLYMMQMEKPADPRDPLGFVGLQNQYVPVHWCRP
jgi:hypothetical protein